MEDKKIESIVYKGMQYMLDEALRLGHDAQIIKRKNKSYLLIDHRVIEVRKN